MNEVPGVDKSLAFSRALPWFGNQHDRTTIRLTTHDQNTATIVGSGEMQCNSSLGAGLRGMGLGRNQNYLRFVVTFQAKDGRSRITFSELFYYLRDLQFPDSNLAQGPANQAEVDILYRDCLQALEVNLMRTVTASGTNDDF